MSNAIQMDHSNSQLALPVKRRRGRPRKDQSINRPGSAQVPPGVERATENTAHQVEKNAATVDIMVGQPVTGIVEATFDAGFLLSVRIGGCKTNLRGIVFKPGHYVPITAENDIAPQVQMIHRNEIHLPAENKIRRRRRYRRRAELNGSPPAPQASKGNQLSIMLAPSVPPVGARGTVVPVVLQPANPRNGLPRSGQAPMDASQAYMEALKEKGVQMVAPLAMLPPDGQTAQEKLPSQMQVSHGGVQDLQNQIGSPSNRRRDVEHGEETKPLASLNVVSPADDSERTHEPPLIKHLEGSQSSHLHLSKSHPSKFTTYGNGRMTELLQVLQENLGEKKVQESDMAAGLRNKSSGIKFPGTENKREATLQ